MSTPKDRFLSREEEVELAQSNKKVKDVNHADYNFSREEEAINQDRYGRNTDEDSDKEVAELRSGVAAVTLSKEVKQRIRAPWVNSLIVKVYGRSVGFHFLQARLTSLWRPSGRMDIIDLGKEFYLVWFGLKEDFSEVLEKGPWFIGEHFLSIRPWEPNFKPSTANISSVAVWIRLTELPIEYYELDVLKQIGKAIGNVLKIDTHTATKARGSYEGIHKLCFSCGRIGHRKDDCVYLLRATSSKERADTDVQSNTERADTGAQSNVERTTCMEHEGVVPTHAQGEGDTVQVGSVGTMDEDSYGPWVVVTRKKSGSKGPYIGSTPASKVLKQERAKEDGLGLKRDGKRKAGPVVIGKRINGPEGMVQASENFNKGKTLKTKANESVRGKKGIAQLRVFSNREVTSSSSIGSLYPVFSLTNIAQPNIDPNFRFST
nr:uncharacterized protein LOC112003850 [Quercus suber]